MVAIPTHVVPVLKEMKLKATTDFVIELDCAHITLALADDVPLVIVKENVGHAQLSTTDKYFSSSGIKMRGQMDRLRVPVHRETGAEVISIKNRK